MTRVEVRWEEYEREKRKRTSVSQFNHSGCMEDTLSHTPGINVGQREVMAFMMPLGGVEGPRTMLKETVKLTSITETGVPFLIKNILERLSLIRIQSENSSSV